MGFLVVFFIGWPVFAANVPTSPTKPVPQLFMTSDRCIACHNGITAPSGQDISIGWNWQSSMMANSSRDPYWQAAVRRETLDHPSASGHIQDECAACHMPMARYQAHAQGMKGSVFPLLPGGLPKGGPDAPLAADGVSCTLCHQIEGQNLGTKKSFVGGFEIDTRTPAGKRRVFGPYLVDHGRRRVMQSSGRFVPEEGLHIQDPGLCGSCHTLYTQTLDLAGNVIGTLPEQVPYLEWRHSDFYNNRTCQSCHMPQLNDMVPISAVLGQPRKHFSRHAFRGGNFFMLSMLRQYADALAVVALPQTLDAAAVETQSHLETRSAEIHIEQARISNGVLNAQLQIINLAGHKLPTAYPSRRAWIHFTVQDVKGKTIFDSGAPQPNGSILGNDNDVDSNRYEPHYVQIRRPDQVQIYEAIMADSKGQVTTGLLSAIRFVKDNRLLPQGFDRETADGDIAVHGRAAVDVNFQGGHDRIRYTVPLQNGEAPFSIKAQLWYQPIAYRWARNLGAHKAPEIQRFTAYYDSMSIHSAVMLAEDSTFLNKSPLPSSNAFSLALARQYCRAFRAFVETVLHMI
jgi:hypothetical protein